MTFQLLWKYPLDIVITVIPIVDLFVSEDFRSSGNWLGKSRFFLSRNMKNYSIPIFASFVQNSAMSKIQERRKENQAKGSILKIRNLPWSLRRVFFLLLQLFSHFYYLHSFARRNFPILFYARTLVKEKSKIENRSFESSCAFLRSIIF